MQSVSIIFKFVIPVSFCVYYVFFFVLFIPSFRVLTAAVFMFRYIWCHFLHFNDNFCVIAPFRNFLILAEPHIN